MIASEKRLPKEEETSRHIPMIYAVVLTMPDGHWDTHDTTSHQHGRLYDASYYIGSLPDTARHQHLWRLQTHVLLKPFTYGLRLTYSLPLDYILAWWQGFKRTDSSIRSALLQIVSKTLWRKKGTSDKLSNQVFIQPYVLYSDSSAQRWEAPKPSIRDSPALPG